MNGIFGISWKNHKIILIHHTQSLKQTQCMLNATNSNELSLIVFILDYFDKNKGTMILLEALLMKYKWGDVLLDASYGKKK